MWIEINADSLLPVPDIRSGMESYRKILSAISKISAYGISKQKYRELKDWWELEEFTGTSCNSIEQELYINLLFSNIAALVKTEADNIVREKAFVKNKWAYQAKKDFYHRRSQSSYAQVPFYVHGNTASYHEF